MDYEQEDDALSGASTPAGASGLTVERSGRLLRLVLNRPATGNALDLALIEALETTLSEPGPGTGAVLITGAGGTFCAGGDLSDFLTGEGSASERLRDGASRLHRAILSLVTLPLPVVAGVRGWAAGAGFGLVLACDIVVAGASTRFKAAYASIGVSPDAGLTWTLPRAVGAQRALELILSDRVLTAEEAHRWGVVGRLVQDDHVDEEAATLARALSEGPREALGSTKLLLRAGADRSLAEQLELEAAGIARGIDTPDGLEGVTAFLERRAPRFGAGRGPAPA